MSEHVSDKRMRSRCPDCGVAIQLGRYESPVMINRVACDRCAVDRFNIKSAEEIQATWRRGRSARRAGAA